MKLKFIFIGFGKKEEELEIEKDMRYSEILEKILKINPETVILLRNSSPIPLDEFAEEGEIKVVRVISGG
ncbi:MAG: MoaD/ThiS family protein [Archaeoglobaceae archaeon]|nr:MoaD/ThiS family protein [Archaeoglobaceae archaeon]MDW8128301.1 MoaD/ThiS family protein [Archaeoglobaceae archaeon]